MWRVGAGADFAKYINNGKLTFSGCRGVMAAHFVVAGSLELLQPPKQSRFDSGRRHLSFLEFYFLFEYLEGDGVPFGVLWEVWRDLWELSGRSSDMLRRIIGKSWRSKKLSRDCSENTFTLPSLAITIDLHFMVRSA